MALVDRVFIQPGDDFLTKRQAENRGEQLYELELSRAGARPGDLAILAAIPHAELPARLQDVLAAMGVTSYADLAQQWEVANATNAANNLFNYHLMHYRKALARLAQYPLAEGRAALTEVHPSNGETFEVAPAIDPLPATIMQPVIDPETGEQTGEVAVPNPAIVQDNEERAEAQAIVAATPPAVVTFHEGPV